MSVLAIAMFIKFEILFGMISTSFRNWLLALVVNTSSLYLDATETELLSHVTTMSCRRGREDDIGSLLNHAMLQRQF